MSQNPNNRGKDAGRKYTSVNVNKTFKGTKGESKSAGSGTRHGLQSLGKVNQSRRAPLPANLPSLKRENLGNDPRINLVPTGSQGWAKKEKPEATTGLTTTQVKPKPEDQKEVSLRPHAGVVVPPKVTVIKTQENQDGEKQTWGAKDQPPKPPSGQSMYFQKEFPILGADGERQMEKDHSQEGEPNVNPQAMDHQGYLNAQKWMEKQSGPMQVPPNFAQYSGDQPSFNGNQPYPYPHPSMYAQGGQQMPMPPYPMPFQFPPGGKMPPFDPRYFSMMKPPFIPKSGRPSVVKDSDISMLDNGEKAGDAGWAGAQEEVDYNAKLKFDESDESDDDDKSRQNGERVRRTPSEKDDLKQKQREAWAEYHGYPPQMAMQFYQQGMQRMPYPGYAATQGSAPPGPGGAGYPPFPMYFMPYRFPPHMYLGVL
jgi:hypothetical protein